MIRKIKLNISKDLICWCFNADHSGHTEIIVRVRIKSSKPKSRNFQQGTVVFSKFCLKRTNPANIAGQCSIRIEAVVGVNRWNRCRYSSRTPRRLCLILTTCLVRWRSAKWSVWSSIRPNRVRWIFAWCKRCYGRSSSSCNSPNSRRISTRKRSPNCRGVPRPHCTSFRV